MTETRRAIVLSGGGARGAYAAGVIRYILEVVAKEISPTNERNPSIHFDIVSGTSVGAINAAWLAATMDEPDFCVSRLWFLWRDMQIAKAVKVSYADAWTMTRRLFSNTSPETLEPRPGRSYSLLDTNYFTELISREIPFANIAKNIDRGLLHAVTITTTDVHTGRTTVFVQSGKMELPPWTRDPRRVAVAGPMSPNKVLASAAIPILFPAVKIGGRWYFDGGLRQNTPIAPALRMGANKILVVSLKSGMGINVPDVDDLQTPTVSFLLGKVLNALLLDPLDYDLSFMERINGLLKHGQSAFDENFIDTLNEVVVTYRGQGYREVDCLLVRPTVDLGALAADFAGEIPSSRWGSRTLATIGKRASESSFRESDFLSYLLFDGGYTGQLLELGFADAREKHDEFIKFFTED